MSEIKHTPGPWIWAEGYRGLYGAGKENQVLDYAHYEGMWLGHVDEQQANARLIAAAPELLDAAQWAANYIDTIVDPTALKVLESLRAAIARATGSKA